MTSQPPFPEPSERSADPGTGAKDDPQNGLAIPSLYSRRQLLRRACVGLGGALVCSAGFGWQHHLMGEASLAASNSPAALVPFNFVQITDTHLGFTGLLNHDIPGTIRKALSEIDALNPRPDFIIHTGDLTNITGKSRLRRERMHLIKKMLAESPIKKYLVPGEADVLEDRGYDFKEIIGELHYSFDHKGVHFIALDNASDGFMLGNEQFAWLKADLAKVSLDTPLILLSHAPLYNIFPAWNWYTLETDKIAALVAPYKQVVAMHGHIHQLHEERRGNITHLAGRPLAWPLPQPPDLKPEELIPALADKLIPKLAGKPQNLADPFKGLGYRIVQEQSPNSQVQEFILGKGVQ